ncbi:VTT domain-containing protein [Enterovibrio sp. ZSDZ42]|uniref:VTT domain-containing protein n=1 Tax=Enterovibrio gelatinilyticus TaxID=2899819 RepID=A0ABT5R6N5_9GAMM|nr:VTT domain-containing protein [Enterovibrio sp. ZSDZ42]MDD1795431.1 VTT domain-containing protein [Enterovibrio sp. ZSDZ42]
MNDVTITLLQYSPLTLFFAVILLSYLLEDLAIITASVAAAQGVMTVPMALLSIFVGIASGDVGLYALGVWARKWRRLRGLLLTKPSVRLIRKKLRANPVSNLFLIRFVPGLRFVGFCLSGFFRVGLRAFLPAVLLATALWTAVVFTLVYQLGEIEWIHSNLSWGLIPVVLILLYGVNRFAGNKLKEKAVCTD